MARSSVGSLLDAFGSRAFGPLLSLCALVVIIPPVSAIPGVPTATAVLIVLISVQMLIGNDHPWVPKFLQKMGVAKDKVEHGRDRSLPWLKRIDALVGPRLRWATGPVPQRLAALATLLAALAIPSA